MMKALCLLLSMAVVGSSACPEIAFARPSAHTVASKGASVVEGSAQLEGTWHPPAAALPPAGVAKTCGREVQDETFRVGPHGELQDVVVSLADVRGRTPLTPGTVTVNQRGCAYLPPVVAATVGSTLVVWNSDSLLHNVRAFGQTPLFNVAMPLAGMKIERKLPSSPGVFHLRCDVHPWMHSVIRTFDHPFFTLTDEKGRFRMEVPPGKHLVTFWHQGLPERSVEVSVESGHTAIARASWKAADARR